jgi:hypothetical protein
MLSNRVTTGGYPGAMPLNSGRAGKACEPVEVTITTGEIEDHAAGSGCSDGFGFETTRPEAPAAMVASADAVEA